MPTIAAITRKGATSTTPIKLGKRILCFTLFISLIQPAKLEVNFETWSRLADVCPITRAMPHQVFKVRGVFTGLARGGRDFCRPAFTEFEPTFELMARK